MTFQIYGDYALTSQSLFEEFSRLDDATRWVKGYTKHGDLGGYQTIEVLTFSDDGEAHCHYRIDAPDEDDNEDETDQ